MADVCYGGCFFLILIPIILAAWVYDDAKKRGDNAAVWAVVVLFTNFIGLLIYLASRKPVSDGKYRYPQYGTQHYESGYSEQHSGERGYTSRCPSCYMSLPRGTKKCPQCSIWMEERYYCGRCGPYDLRAAADGSFKCANCGRYYPAHWNPPFRFKARSKEYTHMGRAGPQSMSGKIEKKREELRRKTEEKKEELSRIMESRERKIEEIDEKIDREMETEPKPEKKEYGYDPNVVFCSFCGAKLRSDGSTVPKEFKCKVCGEVTEMWE